MRVAFRADASSAIGFGHVSRCLALASEAAKRHDVVLLSARAEAALEASAERAGVRLVSMDVAAGSPADARATAEAAGRDATVIVDGYVFTSEYLSALRDERRSLVMIDDLGGGPFPCDVVINHNVSAERTVYFPDPRVEWLLGASFAIVRDAFLNARERRIAERQVEPAIAERVLVTMGGSDPPGATLAVLHALSRIASQSLDVRVVVGAANRRRTDIQRRARDESRHRVEVRADVEDMAAEMLWADAIVTASGVTTSEAACVGIPGIAVAIVDNQEAIAEELGRRGMFTTVALADAGGNAMSEAIAALLADEGQRSTMAAVQRTVIDGLGKRRILARLEERSSRVSRPGPKERETGGTT